MPDTVPAITTDDFNRIMEEEIPFAHEVGMRADAIGDGTAVLRMPASERQLRPGGTVSGPAMMALADAAMYAALLGRIGPVKLAVTTSFNANFLHRPEPADLIAEATVLKAGKRLAVIEVTVRSDGFDAAVAHMTGTYSIPPKG
ncbi:MAG: thioesterase [Rhodospirillaceae bacterium]|nr:thioesterase [Magnetovibrio sp.]MAY66729.1 thioesterase [Rhodospirillaceae bacterium]|tara:strand:- start:179 stop:610 length:432 start_codon:yes stop_codon:yes gene_type:complete